MPGKHLRVCEVACVLRGTYGAALRDEMAQQVTNKAVQKRVPLAKYIKAEVQSRLKPVESKACPMSIPHICPLWLSAAPVELQ